jgi:hypothetical protein
VTPQQDIRPVIGGPTFANRWGYGQYITVLPVLDLVVAHQVAFEEADERAGREIAAVGAWEYDALLGMIIGAIGD